MCDDSVGRLAAARRSRAVDNLQQMEEGETNESGFAIPWAGREVPCETPWSVSMEGRGE